VRDYLRAMALIFFVILAMGIAGSMELHDREAARQPDVMVAEK